MTPVTITLLGEPVAWARTRLGMNGIPFTPTKQRHHAAALRMEAQQAMNGRTSFDGPIRLEVVAEFAVPASWSKKKRAAALAGELRPAKRPDLSNIGKQIEDAFNTVVFSDDALIVDLAARKIYAEVPRLVVTVSSV